MQGSPGSSVDGYSLLYQLLLTQAIYEKRLDFGQVPPLINNHVMLQENILIDSSKAKALYEKLLRHYGIIGDDMGGSQDVAMAESGDAAAADPQDETQEKNVDDNVKSESEQADIGGSKTYEVEIKSEKLEPNNNSGQTTDPVDNDDKDNSPKESNEANEQNERKTIKIESGPEKKAPLEMPPVDAEPDAERQQMPPTAPETENLINLDKLVNRLYMKYTGELRDAIKADKEEFTRILGTIK